MDDEPTTGSVQLIVDYSDGCKKCFNLPWKSSMSVADVLAAAKSTSIGLEFVVNEKNGEIQSIDGVFPPKEPHFVGLWRIWIGLDDYLDTRHQAAPRPLNPDRSILVKVVNTSPHP